jgi:hypothetical protein
MNAYHCPPMTLGKASALRIRLIEWCRDCAQEVELDPAEMAEHQRHRHRRSQTAYAIEARSEPAATAEITAASHDRPQREQFPD